MAKLARIPFPPSPEYSILTMCLLSWAETASGLRGVRRAAKLATSSAVRAKVSELRGPKQTPAALKALDEAAVFLTFIVQTAEERRALGKLR